MKPFTKAPARVNRAGLFISTDAINRRPCRHTHRPYRPCRASYPNRPAFRTNGHRCPPPGNNRILRKYTGPNGHSSAHSGRSSVPIGQYNSIGRSGNRRTAEIISDSGSGVSPEICAESVLAENRRVEIPDLVRAWARPETASARPDVPGNRAAPFAHYAAQSHLAWLSLLSLK